VTKERVSPVLRGLGATDRHQQLAVLVYRRDMPGRKQPSRLAGVDDWADIWRWLAVLRRSRRVFHSEADFQHALALAITASDPGARVRLETRPLTGMRLDLLVSRPDLGGYLAVELKYLTAAWAGEDDGEHFEVLGQGAQDIRAYDDAFRIYEDQVLSGTRAWGP
jgi:hypothetical protein